MTQTWTGPATTARTARHPHPNPPQPAARRPHVPQPPAKQPTKPLCTYCGADGHTDFEVVSRHRTSAGTTVWVRCSCGALQVRVVNRAGAQIVARGRRAGTPSGPGR
ncbi:hypothetical protein [Streptomyces peucetius]|uniref:Uncharacterized protein n=1 Tax=Streptomyces peucetius TaxID=1950 RepID=A0ABY6I8L2_STRPE|nr:hypothetical protein [Streptomyces peucetius]UYQ63039.1 hypothetical protein OGH68_17110 [Streptomyces peucetius]